MTLSTLILAALVVLTVVDGIRSRHRGRSDAGRAPSARTVAARLLTRRRFLHWGGAVAGASVLVYSGADEAIDAWIRDEGTNEVTDPVAHQLKQFGEPYWAWSWLGLAGVNRFVGPSLTGRFATDCMQATAFGLPVLWGTQRLLGASRPTDGHGPGYKPFTDENAASGHTFIAAVPWIVMLRRVRPTWAKALAGLVSPATGWSRMHDRKHYLSQVVLGWVIAWEAVDAVVGRVDGINDDDGTTDPPR